MTDNKPKVDIERVALLANLPLSAEEKKKFEPQLEETLEYVSQLEKIDTGSIEPTSQVTGLENVTRVDEAAPSLSQEEVLKNSNSVHNGFFKVGVIIDNE